MNKRRMLRLAALLEADAENPHGVSFDLTGWVKKRGADDYFYTWAFEPRERVKVECNTAACAWGLAAISAEFKAEGVGYKIIGGGLHPTYRGLEDFEAAEKFFGISKRQAIRLFSPESYPEDKHKGAEAERYVAKRIRRMVARAA